MGIQKKNPTVFRPERKGLRKVFGDLEADVMETIWAHGPATVADVHKVLEGQREIAYTTVKTVMGRLAEKGYLKRTSAERAHVYGPTKSRDEFLREVGNAVLAGLFSEFGQPIAAHLLESISQWDPASLDRLERLIAERRAGQKREEEES